MDAVSTIIQAIDVGVYTSEEGLREAQQNLNASYRANKRLATTQLRVDRAITWVTHLMVRLRDIQEVFIDIPEDIDTKINETLTCLSDQEVVLRDLLLLEDIEALIAGYRQAQSDLKFCHDLALEADRLNTEFEQAEAQNSEPEE